MCDGGGGAQCATASVRLDSETDVKDPHTAQRGSAQARSGARSAGWPARQGSLPRVSAVAS